MHKSKLLLNKPVYTGMTILENSKILMYDFSIFTCKYRPKCKLIYTDTDSLLLDIQMKDVYKDMENDIDLYDTSNYPTGHMLYNDRNKRVLGEMKDECEGLYSVLEENQKTSGKPRE